MPSVFEAATVAEVSEVLRRAAADGLRVSVERPGGDVVLSLARLNRVLEHEAGDLTCTVEAGIRLSALQRHLGAHGQMLALDPPGDPTVGACIAADLAGPRSHRYGAMRDLVLGVTTVLGDGLVASSGGKVVKNVAGYDLGKLFCGSSGTLGVVARVSLRLHPLPEVSATLVTPVASPSDAHAKVQAILRSTLVPSALDLLWPGRLALLVEGGARAVEAQMAAARALVGGEEAGAELWDEVRARQLQAAGRLSFAPSALAETLAGLDEAIVRLSAGVAYTPEPVAESSDKALLALTERVRAAFDPQGVLA